MVGIVCGVQYVTSMKTMIPWKFIVTIIVIFYKMGSHRICKSVIIIIICNLAKYIIIITKRINWKIQLEFSSCYDNSKIIDVWLIIYLTLLSVVTVTFGKEEYTVNEDTGVLQVSLILSNSSSNNIAIEVLSSNGSATGK